MSKTLFQDQELTYKIIAAAIEVHRRLGPGLLEAVYRFCLCYELENIGLKYKQEVTVPIIYRDKKLDCGFRLDLLVENKVVVELKSIEVVLPIHEAQVLTYLRLMNKQVGLLINFNEPVLTKGVRRCVLGAKDNLSSSGHGPVPAFSG
jgi:GxxExxY protein